MSEISPSELIINKDGSIYHLNLKPGEIADTVITVGDPERVSKVSQHFDSIELKRQHREFVTHTGYLNNQRLTVISTGIGTPNIDIVLNELDALVNVDFKTRQIKPTLQQLKIIRIGTTGGLQADIPIGQPVVTTYAVGLDNLLDYYLMTPTPEELSLQQLLSEGLREKDVMLSPRVFAGDEALIQCFSKLCKAGVTITCPGFFGPQGRQVRAAIAYPDLLDQLLQVQMMPHEMTNFEMETSAIYGLGRVLNHRCCSTSLIIANRATKTFISDLDKVLEDYIASILNQLTSVAETDLIN